VCVILIVGLVLEAGDQERYSMSAIPATDRSRGCNSVSVGHEIQELSIVEVGAKGRQFTIENVLSPMIEGRLGPEAFTEL
jgi:hypothetical protein